MSRHILSIGLAISFLALLLLPITKTAAQAATATVTPTRTATPAACTPPPPTYFANVVPSATSVNTGDQIVVRVTSNVGIARFSLSVVDTATGLVQSQTNPIFNPAAPAAQTPPGGVNNVQWTLTAARPGTVIFRGSASGEVQICQGGHTGFTFGAASGQSGSVTVGGSPANTFTPTPTPGGPLSAEFVGSPLTGNAPLSVTFTATGNTAGTQSCTWLFGDGTGVVADFGCIRTFSHTYTSPGSYTVSFHVAGATDVVKTNYVVVSSGPTNTPTLTRTATPTGVSTACDTPGACTPTPTRTPTRTNTPVVGACSPVTSTITVPFTKDGAGVFCYQASSLGAFTNNWNLNSLTINGVNFTSQYVAVGAYPAKINGFYYVGYNGSFPWSHFEAK